MAGIQAAFPVQSFPSSAVTPSIIAGAGITISTANVISVDNTIGAVGTYIFGGSTSATGGAGTTVAGSSLVYAGIYTGCAAILLNVGGGAVGAGTWKRMGIASTVNNGTLYVRIA